MFSHVSCFSVHSCQAHANASELTQTLLLCSPSWPTDCLEKTADRANDRVYQALRDDLGLPSLGIEDSFSSNYYCVVQGTDFKVLAELITAEAEYRERDDVGFWPVTGAKIHSVSPRLKVSGWMTASGIGSLQIKVMQAYEGVWCRVARSSSKRIDRQPGVVEY